MISQYTNGKYVYIKLSKHTILSGIVEQNEPDNKFIVIIDRFLGRISLNYEEIKEIGPIDLLEVPDWTPIKMDTETFKSLLDELDGNSLQTLKEKNARYSINGDCLHNFRSGAEITGRTPAQTCWGYMSKHLVALRDKVERNDFSDREDFLEKCQDTINYIRFLWCIGNEENNNIKGEN